MTDRTLPTRVPDWTLYEGKMAVWYETDHAVALIRISDREFIYAENGALKGFMGRVYRAMLEAIVKQYGDRILK